MSLRPTRRDFIKQTTALGAAWWVGNNSSAYAFADSKSPLERVNFACIGVRGKGDSDSNEAGRHGNMVALCDIDDVSLAAKAERFGKAEKFNDYREMLSKIGDKIDAVTVSIPDHSHASASIRAMRMGKHVFCQKPLTWSVSEARMMRETAAKMGVATQMGNQFTADAGLREAVEVIRAGALGKVQEVHVWTNRPVWPQGTGRPKETQPIPPNVHWDLFLGPAPERPYHSAYHPFKWRGWLDFGTGALGDMACHTCNMPVMALDLFDPLTVVADSSGIVENETYPKWSVIEFEFGPRGDMPPCKLTWYDGGKLPPAELFHGQEIKNSGSLLVGEKGTLYAPGDYAEVGYALLPKERFQDFKKPEPSLPRSPGHFEEFVIACRGGSPAMSNFNYAARLTETILLGNVAMRAGQKIEWDAANLQVINLPDANKFIKREYRKGWEL